MITKPMLAATLDNVHNLKFPVLVTPKLDGIRCLKMNGKAVSRKFLRIPNIYIREQIEKYIPDGVDGELMLMGATFGETTSAVMSAAGKPNFTYCIFDWVTKSLDEPYKDRIFNLNTVKIDWPLFVSLIIPKDIYDFAGFCRFEKECLDVGYEGVIIRSENGPYKCGRSTLKEGYLLKWKRFEDSEAVIIGLVEAQENTNKKEKNELGESKRSHQKVGKVNKGTLGSFNVEDIKTGVQFEIGTGEGLDKELRQEIWDNKNEYIGKILRYKFQAIGVKDKPRFPSFQGFRDPIDL